MISGTIYKITSTTTPNIYIGSTTKTLSHRLSQHKADYNRYLKGTYNYVTSFEIIKGGDYKIECIEQYECETPKELSDREGHWIKTLPNVTNKKIQGRTHKESTKNYYDNNKIIINQKQNEHFDCIHCGGKYSKRNKSTHLKSIKHISISV